MTQGVATGTGMTDAMARFAGYIASLGRGPGRSRPLTRAEAQDAMTLLLSGEADPVQIGAFLMLLRYRGEDPEEIAGLVLGSRPHAAPGAFDGLAGRAQDVALDWPSYGAGRTRQAPWFLLSALVLGQAGIPVLMHGTNDFSGGMTVQEGLAALGLAPALSASQAEAGLADRGFAYVPMAALCPAFAALLGLRGKLGLRSPLNTVARLLNPAAAACGVDGVFHPPYIETHLAVAERLGMGRLLVLKGGGGEAERNPAKPTAVHVWDNATGRGEIGLPAVCSPNAGGADPGRLGFAAVWRGQARHAAIEARIVATIALGLMAVRRGGDAEAHALWEQRHAEL